ncbi:Ankycorbin like [Actinidia chinensis var. chinensis]|uniref:Ankycorbin like n=1 Tax=Actinidia chinensis var. chinensis TaxID=1590841 RepID=A0A2R6RFI3_ACTCC|nr:Ankycorbin like [Actinidia chinensis var. chinensis]
MICARYKQEDCLKLLASAGADFGFVNAAGQCAKSIAGSTQWTLGFQQAVLDVIQGGRIAYSSNPSVFSSLMFVIRANDIETLKKLVERSEIDLDEQDRNEFSAAMLAAAAGHFEAFRLLVFAGADINLRNKYGETAITLSEANKNSDIYEKVILEYALANGSHNSAGFYALHRAAHRGDIESVRVLMRRGYDFNAFDGDGYTPLMLAARGGHGSMCELLISGGARCDIETARLETALKLTRKNGVGNDAECVILDELARKLVLGGAFVKKHTKAGKGCSHRKTLKMVGAAGLLRWGKSCKRNVICKGAEVGPSSAFRWNRRKKFDTGEPGMFRVVTTQNKEVHFVCDGGIEMAQLWVRGIKLVTREAIFGKKQ